MLNNMYLVIQKFLVKYSINLYQLTYNLTKNN